MPLATTGVGHVTYGICALCVTDPCRGHAARALSNGLSPVERKPRLDRLPNESGPILGALPKVIGIQKSTKQEH